MRNKIRFCIFSFACFIALLPVGLQAQLNYTLIPTHLKCYGYTNGSINLVINSGQPPYTFNWSNGAQTEDINNLTAGLYTVTVTDHSGNINTKSVIVTQPEPINVGVMADTNICEGATVTLSATVTGGTKPYYYSWLCNASPCNLDNNAILNPEATLPVGTTTYYLQISDTNTCISNIDSLTITVFGNPTVDAGADVSIIRGETTTLQATGTYINTYNWTPSSDLSDSTVPDPIASPLSTITYKVTVLSLDGCEDTDSVTITVNEPGDMINLFTPNGDGVNDTWVIKDPYLLKGCSLTIFNRWGKEVYKTKDYQNDWDGTSNGEPLPEGAYYYVINCEGSTTKGYVNILRFKN